LRFDAELHANLLTTQTLRLEKAVSTRNISGTFGLSLEFKSEIRPALKLNGEERSTPLTAGPGAGRILVSPAVVRRVAVPAPTSVQEGQIVPYAGVDFGAADPNPLEQDIYSFDFTARLAAGEGLTSSSWQMSLVTGTDPNPSGHLIGPSTFTGNISSQIIGGLFGGREYLIICTITTDFDRTLTAFSHVQCVAPS
jgi:hypothetical protein